MKRLAAISIGTILIVLAILAPIRSEAQSDVARAAPFGLVAADGAGTGQVVLDRNVDEEPRHYRVGWAAYADYEAGTSAGREWSESFAFVDLENRGQTSRTLSRLTPGNWYAFIVGRSDWRFGAPNWSDWITHKLVPGSDSYPALGIPLPTPTPTPVPAASASGGVCDSGAWSEGLQRSAELTQDCEVLLEIRDALGGEVALGWSADLPIGAWEGVRLGNHPTRVTQLEFADAGLTGTLPSSLGKLDALEFLTLPRNRLTGDIPPELGNLSRLERLDLNTNRLTGGIPPELGDLSRLRYLNVAVNRLTGPIPVEIANLSELETLDAGQNWLTGTLPAELARLANLRELLLGSNLLSGEIPVQLVGLPDLERVDVAANEFTGCVPDGLKVRDASIGNMRFCGAPPLEWDYRPTFEGGIDLGVEYIERLPRFPRYTVSYFDGRFGCPYPFDEFQGPFACPEETGSKRWPDPGETVQLIAHVWNFGDTRSGSFQYRWTMNGAALDSGTHNGLGAGEHTTFALALEWPQYESNPAITFAVDPKDDIPELIEFNNEVVDWIKGYTIAFSFMPEAYQNLRRLHWGDRLLYSPEHYVHQHTSKLNELFAEAGLDDRVRAEILVLSEDPSVGESHPAHPYVDGWRHLWDDKPLFTHPNQRHPDISWGLLHEVLHQLGVIDLYQMYVNVVDNEVPDANRPGRFAGCGEEYWGADDVCFRFDEDIDDVMAGLAPYIGAHTAGGLAANSGYRRGYYGEYLYDTPTTTTLKVVNEQGASLPNVALSFYQLEDQPRGRVVDATPEFEVKTDDQGLTVLPNRGITGIVTETGHQLRPNPFGVIDVVGRNGLFVIEMEGTCVDCEWLTIVELNLAYWDGQIDETTITKVLRCPR